MWIVQLLYMSLGCEHDMTRIAYYPKDCAREEGGGEEEEWKLE